MKFIALLFCMAFSLSTARAQQPASSSEEISSLESKVLVDEDCGCRKKKKP